MSANRFVIGWAYGPKWNRSQSNMSVIFPFLARIKHLGAQHVSASPIANMNADAVCHLCFGDLSSGSLCNFPNLDSNEWGGTKCVTYIFSHFWFNCLVNKLQAYQDIACIMNSWKTHYKWEIWKTVEIFHLLFSSNGSIWCYMASAFV